MATFASIAKNMEIDFEKEIQKLFENPLVMDFIVRGIWADIYLTGKVGGEQISIKTNKSFTGVYSEQTIFIKKRKGQKVSNVTLSDTGKLRLSTELKAYPTFAQITAEFEKKNGSVFDNFSDMFANRAEFEKTVLTLSPKRYNELINKYLINGLKEIIIKKITTL